MTQIEQLTAAVEVVTVAIALLGALFAGLLAILEHWRWKRTFALEERRWAEQLNNQVELELLKSRIKEYPGVIAQLKTLSGREISHMTPSSAQQVGQALHDELYKPAVFVMQGDTRKAMVNLRDACFLFAVGEVSSDLIDEARKYLLSALFRDMGSLGSLEDWNPQLPSSIEKMQKRLESLAERRIKKSS